MFYIELLKKLSCCMYSFFAERMGSFSSTKLYKNDKSRNSKIVTERQTIKHKQN